MILWLDMEMTGLDVEIEVPIEVACIVTDWQFNKVAEYHAIIKQPESILAKMDKWNTEHHTSSGLLAQIPNGQAITSVEAELCSIVKTHFGRERAILAGNSIGQDRLFINKYMPQLAGLLHYRMLDVTAWKVIYNNHLSIKFPKKQLHRAMDDVQESIDEMKFYLQFVQKPNL